MKTFAVAFHVGQLVYVRLIITIQLTDVFDIITMNHSPINIFMISLRVSFYCPSNDKAEYFCFSDPNYILNNNNNNILLWRHLWATKISSQDFTLTNANILLQFLPRPSWFPCDTVGSPDVNFTQWTWNETLTWVQYNCCSYDIIQEYIPLYHQTN